MLCPNCSTEAGDAAVCPSCGKSLTAPASAPVQEPAPAADPMEAAAKSGWRTTFLTIAIAVVLGIMAGYLARKFLGAGPDPVCGQLCQFAGVPAVANNPAWQKQIADARCRCEIVPQNAPPAQPMRPAVPPAVPAPPTNPAQGIH